MTEMLTTWNDGAAKQAVVHFVERTVSQNVPLDERVAVFDNDGTVWCEKLLPIQADFILRRLYEMAEADADLRGRQPWSHRSTALVGTASPYPTVVTVSKVWRVRGTDRPRDDPHHDPPQSAWAWMISPDRHDARCGGVGKCCLGPSAAPPRPEGALCVLDRQRETQGGEKQMKYMEHERFKEIGRQSPC